MKKKWNNKNNTNDEFYYNNYHISFISLYYEKKLNAIDVNYEYKYISNKNKPNIIIYSNEIKIK